LQFRLHHQNLYESKITCSSTRDSLGLQDKLFLGNLDAKRDWGHAKDYVKGMWKILQAETPEDFVLATGITTTVRDFTSLAFEEAGIQLTWQGQGVEEKGIDAKTGQTLVEVDPRYFRPTEVDLLIGDPSKAQEKLGWELEYDLASLVKEMVQFDLQNAKKSEYLKEDGFQIMNYFE
jgi:GDPmannose 4,6-dehydratase